VRSISFHSPRSITRSIDIQLCWMVSFTS